VPHFLGEHDHPWLRVLLEEHERFVGQPQRELDARLREPLPCESPPTKRKQAVHVLSGRRPSARKSVVPPARAREMVFAEAARASTAAGAVLSSVAASLGVSAGDLQDSLFADLPGERLVAAPPRALSPAELALRTNLAIVQALLFRAVSVTIEADGNARALVRHSKLRGLICTVAGRAGPADSVLELSGPFALLRHTRLYGHALGEPTTWPKSSSSTAAPTCPT
jgi:predicted nuclease of restriction endonuclease-like RecB superfamily